MEEQKCKTPLEDLRKDDLEHYEEAASSIHCHHSEIPKAINQYYDIQISRERESNNPYRKALIILGFVIFLYAVTIVLSVLLNQVI